jgi:ABC-type Fe3+ transport system substrate-binding protein
VAFDYNTDRLKGDAIPKTWDDLLKPQYKGRIASSPYAGGMPYLASPQVWGLDKATAWGEKFAAQLGGLVPCPSDQHITDAEFDIFGPGCGDYLRIKALGAKGQPIDSFIPSDLAILAFSYLAVPVHAAHPNAGRLWTDYMMSRDAQDLLFEVTGQDFHKIPGSKSAPGVEQVQNGGGKVVEVDLDFFARDAAAGYDRNAASSLFVKMFTTK